MTTTSVLSVSYLVAVLLAGLALWTIRFEFGGKAATRLQWAAPAAFAVLAAAVLLAVSTGKRFELWAAVIVVGLVAGAVAGALKKVNQDHGRQLIRVPPAWDGVGATALLLLLALLRFVTSSLMGRQSSGFGVLAAGATFLAAYIAARFIVVRFYKAPKSIHLDMTHGRDPHRTLAH
ncbi:hypothetical protein SAMN02990966_07712 [Rhodospirillales bacterium URHD0017]|nr:hypothetical protein SAMN02990966_07712 [Rhodospirillales bacterium URHD0017]